jgi:hypothetical protein
MQVKQAQHVMSEKRMHEMIRQRSVADVFCRISFISDDSKKEEKVDESLEGGN